MRDVRGVFFGFFVAAVVAAVVLALTVPASRVDLPAGLGSGGASSGPGS